MLVDARVAPDYLFGHIDGAVSVPFDSVQQAAGHQLRPLGDYLLRMPTAR